MYHKRVSIIIIGLWRVLGLGAEVFGQSTELCSNGGSYPGGGCCGDGVVNGGSAGGEECDNGTVFNAVVVHPFYDIIPPDSDVLCSQSCTVMQGGSPGSLKSNNSHACPYYKLGEALGCVGSNLVQYRYNSDGSACGTLNSSNFGGLGGLVQAGCFTADCNENTLYSCNVGQAIGRAGNNWVCSLGGVGSDSCSLSVPPCSAPNSCGTPGACFAPTTCCDGSSQCNAGSCPADNNGAAAGCGGGSFSCTGTSPPAHSNTSTTTPSTNTNRTYDSNLGSACTRRCNSGYTENGGLCIPDSYQGRTCTAHNTRTALNSCTTYVYNPSLTYGLGNFVCLNTTDPAPAANRCVVCSSNAGNPCTSASNNCGVSAGGVYDCAGNCNAVRPIDTIPCTPCVPNVGASCTSTNNNCSESNAGTVQCDGSCNAVAPPDRNPCAATPSAGVCGDGGNGGSYDGHCLSVAPAINVNFSAHTWTCPGTNGGQAASCSRTVCADRCGDGVRNGCFVTEECDGSDGVSGGEFCTSSCQRACTASNNYSCDNITTRRISGTRSDCSTFNEVDPVRPFNTCCQGGSWITSPSAGADNNPTLGDPTDFSCYGNTLTWNANAGAREGYDSCGQAPYQMNCDTIGFGVNYVCNANRAQCPSGCCVDPKLKVVVHYCALTGAANTYSNCLNALPINRPFAAYNGAGANPSADSQDHYNPPMVTQARCSGGNCSSSEQANATASLYNAAGGLIETRGRTAQLGDDTTVIQFRPNTNTTYHVQPGNIGPGWVLLTGGSAMTRTRTPPSPYAGRPHHSQFFPSSVSFGYSNVVSNALQMTFASDALGTAYFYYYCPSGNCPVMRKLYVNVILDRANDGFSTSQYTSDNPIGNVLVQVYSGAVLIASGYTSDQSPSAELGYWPNLGWRGGFAQGRRGIAAFDVMSDRSYQVVITPPAGYNVASSAPYHRIQQDIRVTEQAYSIYSADWNGNNMGGETLNYGAGGVGGMDIVFSYDSATGYTVTVPRDDDVYAMTRLIASEYDVSLDASIVNPRSVYAPGSTIQVRYQLQNQGYLTYNPDVEISIMTGLVPNGPAVLSGDCPAFDSNGGLYYGYYASDNGTNSFGAFRSSSQNIGMGCDFISTILSGGPRCASKYVEGMFVTYYNDRTSHTNYYSYADRYPVNNVLGTDLFYYVRQDGSGGPNRLRPTGHGIFMNTNNNVLITTGLVAGGVCDITINYIVSGGVLNSSYRSRACAIPQDDNSSPATDEMDRIPSIVGDNCSNIDYQIGVPSCVLPASLGGTTIAAGSGVVAWAEASVPGDVTSRCQSEYRECVDGTLSGSFTNLTCVKQCQQTWASGGTVQVNPGSSVTAQEALIATRAQDCNCRSTELLCTPISITGSSTVADPGGRAYTGGAMMGLSGYNYPALPGCYLSSECTCVAENVDLYEVYYSMSGNTVLGNNRVVDQVHSNVCLIPSSFTGRLASNEVRITFYSGSSVSGNTGDILFGPVSGSVLAASSSTGMICGPYVEYEFAKPLYPGAEGYFFYEFKLLKSVSEDPSVASGANCVWIYRDVNGDHITNTPFSQLSSTIDPGDFAQRFASNAFNSVLILDPLGQLEALGNNYICVPPPTSICPANTIQQRTRVGVNMCGNGVQELNEQCDDGSYNNDDGSYRYGVAQGFDITEPLYNNYCTTECKLGVPLVCEWSASCSAQNVSSIQEGEQYPFWWNIGEIAIGPSGYNSGFTTVCNAELHANKIMIGGGYPDPLCTFELRSFYDDGVSTGSSVVYTFSDSCFGNTVGSLPMFNLSGDTFVHERAGLAMSANTVSKSRDSNTFASIKSYSLDQIKTRIIGSQGSRLIPLTGGLVNGRLGEYEISLTRMDYLLCVQSATLTRQADGSITTSYSYAPQASFDLASVNFCSDRFIVTKPYVVQEGSLLSTLDASDFSKFYTSATRLLDQTVESTYGTDVLTRVNRVTTYIPTLSADGESNNEFVSKFIEKYTTLATSAGTSFTYSHSFKDITEGSRSATLYKVPTRDIFVYNGTDPLYLSDYGLRNGNDLIRNTNPFTIIASNADVVIFGDMNERNVMVITNENIVFAGGSLSSSPQEVSGIFVSNGYGGSVLKNDLTTRRWIDDGRLVVNGLIIGPNISDLSDRRRSVIEGWFSDGDIDNTIIAKRRKSLVEGASLRMVPNPQLFTSPPPGTTELLESLVVAR